MPPINAKFDGPDINRQGKFEDEECAKQGNSWIGNTSGTYGPA